MPCQYYGTLFQEQSTNVYFGGRTLQAQDVTGIKQDRLGTTSYTTTTYAPYGDTGISPPPYGDGLGFTGYYRDGSTTGLDYAQQRYYAPSIGRFTSADPYNASAAVARPQSWNRYVYVENDPVNATDPSGLSAITLDRMLDQGYCRGYGLGDLGGDLCGVGGGGYTGRPTSDAAAFMLSGGLIQDWLTMMSPMPSAPKESVESTITYHLNVEIPNDPPKDNFASTVSSVFTKLPQMFYGGFVDLLLNDKPSGMLAIGGSLALVVGPQAVATALAPSTLYHFTSAEAAAAIKAAGTIYPSATGVYGAGVYGSAFNWPIAASLMGASSTEAVVPFSAGLGTVGNAITTYGLPSIPMVGSYTVVTRLAFLAGLFLR